MLLRTDRAGDIIFRSDGARLTLRTVPELVFRPRRRHRRWAKRRRRRPQRATGRLTKRKR